MSDFDEWKNIENVRPSDRASLLGGNGTVLSADDDPAAKKRRTMTTTGILQDCSLNGNDHPSNLETDVVKDVDKVNR